MQHQPDHLPPRPAPHMEHTLTLAKVMLDCPLGISELSAFRGAIIDFVGEDRILFHNHEADRQPGYRLQYPLVQYRVWENNGALLFLGEAEKESQLFELGASIPLRIYSRELKARVRSCTRELLNLKMGKEMYSYRIVDYLGLNERNHGRWLDTHSYTQKLQILEKALVGHILNFAEGIDWRVPIEVKCEITTRPIEKPLSIKNVKEFSAFSFDFRTNVLLPEGIGLGKSTRFHGEVRRN